MCQVSGVFNNMPDRLSLQSILSKKSKGEKITIKIEYPKGYDPDHDEKK